MGARTNADGSFDEDEKLLLRVPVGNVAQHHGRPRVLTREHLRGRVRSNRDKIAARLRRVIPSRSKCGRSLLPSPPPTPARPRDGRPPGASDPTRPSRPPSRPRAVR